MKTEFTTTYAQNREDIILEGFFIERKGKPGFYVDVGAGSPMDDSVTRLFYQQEWRGINIEPIGHIHKSLVLHRGKDINLNIGVSNTEGVLTFREYAADGFSTFSEDIQEQYSNKPDEYTVKYEDYEVETETLASIFKKQKVKDIQFLKIDVEGYEYEVIESNDWKNFRPEVLCIEANHVKKDWRGILLQNKYKLSFFDGLNEYYVDSIVRPGYVFPYVEAVINRGPIIDHKIASKIVELNEQINRSVVDIKYLKMHIQYTEAQNAKLNDQIHQMNNPLIYLKMKLGAAMRKLRT